MTHKLKSGGQPKVVIDAEVARQIRQHARSSIKTEICGVLIGQDHEGTVEIEASITGLNADEAGAHVTFTQDTWEHIYKVKDQTYPDERIVGWYHSHPGFGVFLSDHDTFIHQNFFSSPGQVAWVFDPHSDEEGCFGWVSGKVERLSRIAVLDRRGGERAGEINKPEPMVAVENGVDDHRKARGVEIPDEDDDDSSLQRLVTNFFSYLTAILLGFLLCWYVFPRVVVMGVPVDPQTGQPLSDSMVPSSVETHRESVPGASQSNGAPADRRSSQEGHGSVPKGDHGQPK